MSRFFEIQTLSDRNYPRLADPVTIITGGIALFTSLFPNFFGSERATMADFNKLFPSNGYWTVKFKNFLLSKLKYQKDITRDLLMYTVEFVQINSREICNSSYSSDCLNQFYNILRKEESTGGSSPVGNVFGSGINYETLMYIGLGVLAVALLTKSKKKK